MFIKNLVIFLLSLFAIPLFAQSNLDNSLIIKNLSITEVVISGTKTIQYKLTVELPNQTKTMASPASLVFRAWGDGEDLGGWTKNFAGFGKIYTQELYLASFGVALSLAKIQSIKSIGISVLVDENGNAHADPGEYAVMIANVNTSKLAISPVFSNDMADSNSQNIASTNQTLQQSTSASTQPSTPTALTYPYSAIQILSNNNPLSLSDMVDKMINPLGFRLLQNSSTLIDNPVRIEITRINPSAIEMRGVQVYLLQDKYPKNPNALNQPAIGLNDRLDLLSGKTTLNNSAEGSDYAIANTIYPSVRMFFMNPGSATYIRAISSAGSIDLPSSSGQQILAFFSTHITQAMAFDVNEQASVKAFANLSVVKDFIKVYGKRGYELGRIMGNCPASEQYLKDLIELCRNCPAKPGERTLTVYFGPMSAPIDLRSMGNKRVTIGFKATDIKVIQVQTEKESIQIIPQYILNKVNGPVVNEILSLTPQVNETSDGIMVRTDPQFK